MIFMIQLIEHILLTVTKKKNLGIALSKSSVKICKK